MCVVEVGGVVLCVGDNGFGQLGDESETSSSVFVAADLRR
jgi:hypothetical protein